MHGEKLVTVVGGGTGTFAVLSALREVPKISIAAVMNMVDDGGSNKVIRDEFGLLPTSGIRQAMVALTKNTTILRELFNYRFHQGEGIRGMTFGNLFLAAVADISGSQREAIKQTAQLLSVEGSIFPISYDDVRLVATYEDGSEVVGEHAIDEPEHDGTLRITDIRTEPPATIDSEAKDAIRAADLVILGPGDLYTNTLTNLIIDGTVEALVDSNAFIIFIINLMTKYGDTFDYKASDFVEDLGKYFPLERLNAILINDDNDFPPEILAKYEAERSKPVEDDLDLMALPSSIQIFRRSLISGGVAGTQKGDVLKRSMIRHDTTALAAVVVEILANLETS